MADRSAIEWTEATWNPTTGCDRISPGCDHCYALTLAARLKAMGQPAYQRDGDPRTSGPGFGLTLHPDRLSGVGGRVPPADPCVGNDRGYRADWDIAPDPCPKSGGGPGDTSFQEAN